MIAKKKIMGLIATAAAVAFVSAPITSTLANANHNKVNCYGVNSCKGKGSCKSTNSCKGENSCKGHNSCKGKGMKMMSAKKCAKMGGTTDAPKAD